MKVDAITSRPLPNITPSSVAVRQRDMQHAQKTLPETSEAGEQQPSEKKQPGGIQLLARLNDDEKAYISQLFAGAATSMTAGYDLHRRLEKPAIVGNQLDIEI